MLTCTYVCIYTYIGVGECLDVDRAVFVHAIPRTYMCADMHTYTCMCTYICTHK